MYHYNSCSHILSLQTGQTQRGNLFLSGSQCLSGSILSDNNITAVLSIIDKTSYKYGNIKKKIEHNQIKYHKWIDIEDMEDVSIYPYLNDSSDLIHSWLKEHNVVVHCQMGISRSTSLVLAYLMKQHKMPYIDARKMVQSKRSCIQPNDGFVRDLIRFEKELAKL